MFRFNNKRIKGEDLERWMCYRTTLLRDIKTSAKSTNWIRQMFSKKRCGWLLSYNGLSEADLFIDSDVASADMRSLKGISQSFFLQDTRRLSSVNTSAVISIRHLRLLTQSQRTM